MQNDICKFHITIYQAAYNIKTLAAFTERVIILFVYKLPITYKGEMAYKMCGVSREPCGCRVRQGIQRKLP